MRTPDSSNSLLARTALALGLSLAFAAATLPRAQAQAAPDVPVVTTAWLDSHLHDPNLVLLHIGKESDFAGAHLPGAHFVSLKDFSARPGALTLEMPTADELRQKLQDLGVSKDSRIVVYFGGDWISPATRVLFTLQAAGLGAQADLLDGGLSKWRREKRAVGSEPAAVAHGTLGALELHPAIVDNAYVREHAGKPGFVLIDARAPMFYRGLMKSGADGHERRGHIPGARNLPFTSVANDDLTYKSPAELLALFREAGVKPGDKVIAYCHIGQQATAVLFAARLAGIDAVLYDGSFEDWTARGLPVES